MLKLLVPVDGSETSLRAVDPLVKNTRAYKEGVEIHLLNVQPPMPFGGHVTSLVGHRSVDDYHKEEGMKELEPARQKLDAAGIAHQYHIAVGDPGEVIAQFAKDLGCDQIFMGTHGRGVVTKALLGSVAAKVIELAPVPVVLVK